MWALLEEAGHVMVLAEVFLWSTYYNIRDLLLPVGDVLGFLFSNGLARSLLVFAWSFLLMRVGIVCRDYDDPNVKHDN